MRGSSQNNLWEVEEGESIPFLRRLHVEAKLRVFWALAAHWRRERWKGDGAKADIGGLGRKHRKVGRSRGYYMSNERKKGNGKRSFSK